MIKWILLLILAAFVFKAIQGNMRYRKKQKKLNAKYGIGPYHKKARGVKTLGYASDCFEKGKKEKGIRALEGIASQEGWLEDKSSNDHNDWQRFCAASVLLHLAILGSCEKRYFDLIKFSIEAPEYKNREKAKEIAGWLLEDEKRNAALWARNNKRKPEEYHNYVYFVLALLCTDGEERFVHMKKAAECKSNEARWWLLRNGLFEKAFPEKERQENEYYNLYYALKRQDSLWSGDVGAKLPLKRWMIREGGFPEELLLKTEKKLGEATAIKMRREVTDELNRLKKKKDSVGKDTLERIERQNKADDDELKRLIIQHKVAKEAADEFNQWMDEFTALRAEAEVDTTKRTGTSKKGTSGEFDLASMPMIVYDDSNRQWKRRGIFGDHAVYYNDDGGEVTIYSAQISGDSAGTSAGTLHWY